LKYTEHKPSEILEQYVKCYYTLQQEENRVVEDHAYATGCVEVMFTFSGKPHRSNVELWGQILQPLPFRTSGPSDVFGIRFHPGTAAFFVNDDVSLLNNKVADLAINSLYERLQDSISVVQRIELVEAYLLKKLADRPKIVGKIDLVRQVMTEVTHKDFFDNIENVAERYGITSRYLQKVFVQHTGLTPKLYMKINRFQNTLVMMSKEDMSLTSIAHACGYFDQSHFIREFKSFTGYSPSGFNTGSSTAILASPNK
jgi:AraC-like DNA-binding protein